MGLDKVQEPQLTSTDSSHEVEGLFWLNFGERRYFITVLISDVSLFYTLLGGRHYPEGLSRIDADEIVIAMDAWASSSHRDLRWPCF